MIQIFLSYSRVDQAPAQQLAKDLSGLGHAVWFDQNLSGGQAWWDQSRDHIRASAVFVVVLSEASLRSRACQLECGHAAELRRPILPVLVGDGLSLNVLPPALSQVQFIDFRQRQAEAIIALSRALHSLPVGVPLPDPLPPPPEVPLSYLSTLSQQVESPSTLSIEYQSRLVLELKTGLRDPASFPDARELLSRQRDRRDLV
ncbi:MAG: toll/interleukin-1 receptor domain-containing protein, partial [Cyanobium sp.]